MKIKIKEERHPKTKKPITVISGINHNPEVIEKLSSRLKSSCGTGGHTEGKTIILQGTHSKKIIPILEKEGFTI